MLLLQQCSVMLSVVSKASGIPNLCHTYIGNELSLTNQLVIIIEYGGTQCRNDRKVKYVATPLKRTLGLP